jgi:general stress protein YciG
MPGTKAGAQRSKATMLERYGSSYYAMIGQRGGRVNRPESRLFSVDRDAARRAGTKGGQTRRKLKSSE